MIGFIVKTRIFVPFPPSYWRDPGFHPYVSFSRNRSDRGSQYWPAHDDDDDFGRRVQRVQDCSDRQRHWIEQYGRYDHEKLFLFSF